MEIKFTNLYFLILRKKNLKSSRKARQSIIAKKKNYEKIGYYKKVSIIEKQGIIYIKVL